jgi:hypothetical protein
MPIDFSQYQPPGVYIQETPNAGVSVVGVQPTVVAIIGPALGYRSATETVVLHGTTPLLLQHLGIDPTTVVVANAAGTPYVVTTDYTTTVGGGADANTATTPDNTLTVQRAGSGGISDGATVYVSYRYADTDYYAPYQSSDFNAIQAKYGNPIDPTSGAIVSPLSLAAQTAFNNGANQLVLVATPTATVTRTQLASAYTQLGGIPNVNVIVPLTVGLTGTAIAPGDVINVATDLAIALDTRFANGMNTVGIVGYETTVTVLPDVIASGVADERVVVAWPNQLSFFNGFTNSTITVGGYYLAAAYGGLITSLPVQMPLTKKSVRGFAGIPATLLQTMTMALKNTWSKAGVAVTEANRQGNLIIRHGVTTAGAGAVESERELSLVRAKDALVDLISRTADGSGLIGTPITVQTVPQVKGLMSGVLETAVSSNIIFKYSGLAVAQQTGDPTVILVTFQYVPAYPLNYIQIQFSINTVTGETTTINPAAAAA